MAPLLRSRLRHVLGIGVGTQGSESSWAFQGNEPPPGNSMRYLSRRIAACSVWFRQRQSFSPTSSAWPSDFKNCRHTRKTRILNYPLEPYSIFFRELRSTGIKSTEYLFSLARPTFPFSKYRPLRKAFV